MKVIELREWKVVVLRIGEEVGFEKGRKDEVEFYF